MAAESTGARETNSRTGTPPYALMAKGDIELKNGRFDASMDKTNVACKVEMDAIHIT
jgi:hypothetical protein